MRIKFFKTAHFWGRRQLDDENQTAVAATIRIFGLGRLNAYQTPVRRAKQRPIIRLNRLLTAVVWDYRTDVLWVIKKKNLFKATVSKSWLILKHLLLEWRRQRYYKANAILRLQVLLPTGLVPSPKTHWLFKPKRLWRPYLSLLPEAGCTLRAARVNFGQVGARGRPKNCSRAQ